MSGEAFQNGVGWVERGFTHATPFYYLLMYIYIYTHICIYIIIIIIIIIIIMTV